ncbi:TetR/AcrR family transcriptional regulator [Paenibacillus physcomitrellae]|uniref:TetR family transcriptional regulator n=1 Tax=Paenibacillus physcomitrellae TaxID=1619311 RepID=A0ABQ1GFB6_9BACL|nr:TetR/AcrR family transcriptional regulator [Paenibacillus physcomitrellae]GGA42741.1 TetR family transcriptional regulator [Paenibacillus physcomitrellae]
MIVLSDRSADKKQLILQMALKLFSTQGARTTSMQDIADACGISKGSLYLHFKSKEELETAISLYCLKKLEDQLLLVEHEAGLSPRERLYRQILVLLQQVVELREYLKMQFMDHSRNGKLPLEHEHIRRNNLRLLLLMQKKLLDIYGPGISPYIGDMLLLINGMIGSSIQLMLIFSSFPFSLEKVAGHLMELFDHTANLYMNGGSAPLIPPQTLDEWIQREKDELPEAPRHPLLVLQQLRQELTENLSETKVQEAAYETLSILEEEFLRPEPRKAILTGMLHNLSYLEEEEAARSTYLELKQLVLASLGAHPSNNH